MQSIYFNYYAILVIILCVMLMVLTNSRLGGWLIRVMAIVAIVMSVMIINGSYTDVKPLTTYIDQGRAIIKDIL